MTSAFATRRDSRSNSADRSRGADRGPSCRHGQTGTGQSVVGEPLPGRAVADGDPGAGRHVKGSRTERRRGAASRRVAVAIADGHEMFRAALEQTLRSWPEFDVVATVGDASILDVVANDEVQVVLVDPSSIPVPHDELLAAIQAHCQVVIIREGPRPGEVYRLLTSGAIGFLGKDCSEQEVCDAVLAASRDESRIGTSVQPLLAGELRLRRGGAEEFLTGREIEILKLMATGLSAPDIAVQLSIRTPTVKTHQANIYERLGVHDGKAAVARAMRLKLIE